MSVDEPRRNDSEIAHRIWLRWGDVALRACDIAAVLEELQIRTRKYDSTDWRGTDDWRDFCDWLRRTDPALLIVDDVLEPDEQLRELVQIAAGQPRHQLIVLSRFDWHLEGLDRIELDEDMPPAPERTVRSSRFEGGSAAHQSYAREVARNLDYFAAWPPDMPVRVGDVGVLRNGPYSGVSTLSDHGIRFSAHKGRPSHDLKLQSGSTRLEFGDGTITIEFPSRGGMLLWAHDISSSRIEDLTALERQLLREYEKGTWDHSWVVVTEVVRCEQLTVFVSDSSHCRATLSVASRPAHVRPRASKASRPVPSLSLDAVMRGQYDLHVDSMHGMAFSFVGQRGCTPLFRLARLKRPLLGVFGAPRLELLTPRDWT